MGNRVSFQKEFGLIVVGAIIFTASFLWKDLLTDIEEAYFPKGYGLTGRVIFTVLITAILILIAINLRSFFNVNPNPSDAKDADEDPPDGDDDHDSGGDHGTNHGNDHDDMGGLGAIGAITNLDSLINGSDRKN